MRKIALPGTLAFACVLASTTFARPLDIGSDAPRPSDACCVSDPSADWLRHGKSVEAGAETALAPGELTAFGAAPERDDGGPLTSLRGAWSNFSPLAQPLDLAPDTSASLGSRPLLRAMLALAALTFLLRLKQR